MKPQIPFTKDNIYPLSVENFKALFLFYFKKRGILDEGDLSYVFNHADALTLLEVEYVAHTVLENIEYFRTHFHSDGLTIRNLMTYGIDAYLGNFTNCSANRRQITSGFRNIAFNPNSGKQV